MIADASSDRHSWYEAKCRRERFRPISSVRLALSEGSLSSSRRSPVARCVGEGASPDPPSACQEDAGQLFRSATDPGISHRRRRACAADDQQVRDAARSSRGKRKPGSRDSGVARRPLRNDSSTLAHRRPRATGLPAIFVLLLVMNWFFHRVDWTGWISHHHRRRRGPLAADRETTIRRTLLGFGLLGFTSIYREGFEIVVFPQNLRVTSGSSVVLEGVTLGCLFTAAVGVLTFALHQRLPYKRLLIITGRCLSWCCS